MWSEFENDVTNLLEQFNDADKIVMLSFMILCMDLLMISDKKILLCLVMLPFISFGMDLLIMSEKNGVYVFLYTFT